VAHASPGGTGDSDWGFYSNLQVGTLRRLWELCPWVSGAELIALLGGCAQKCFVKGKEDPNVLLLSLEITGWLFCEADLDKPRFALCTVKNIAGRAIPGHFTG